MDEQDREDGIVRWEVEGVNGETFEEVSGVNGVKGYRIPADKTYASGSFDNMQFMDVVVTGYKPNYLGQSRLGSYLKVFQGPIKFTQRIYPAYCISQPAGC